VRRSLQRVSFSGLVRAPAGIDWQAHWPKSERRSSSRKSGRCGHYILRAAPRLLASLASYSASSVPSWQGFRDKDGSSLPHLRYASMLLSRVRSRRPSAASWTGTATSSASHPTGGRSFQRVGEKRSGGLEPIPQAISGSAACCASRGQNRHKTQNFVVYRHN